MVEVIARADREPSGPLLPYELDQIVECRVENPRIFNGRVSYDLAK